MPAFLSPAGGICHPFPNTPDRAGKKFLPFECVFPGSGCEGGILCEELKELCEKENIEILPLLEKHIDLIHEMPFFHNDPFDRMIIAQAQSENLTIITKDSKIKLYDVNVLW